PSGYKKEPYAVPTQFFAHDKQSNVVIHIETNSNESESAVTQGVNRLRVSATDMNRDGTCVRTQHCIPPSSTYFYYEVRIVRGLSSPSTLAVGFGSERTHLNQLPGWFSGSWAYHSDDGKLYIQGDGRVPSSDFGLPGEYRTGDTVGVGLNLKTGKGY